MNSIRGGALLLCAATVFAAEAEAASFRGVFEGHATYDPLGVRIENPFPGHFQTVALEALVDGAVTIRLDMTDALAPVRYLATLELRIENVVFGGAFGPSAPFGPVGPFGPFDISLARKVFAGAFPSALASASTPLVAAASVLFPGGPGAVTTSVDVLGTTIDVGTLFGNAVGGPLDGMADVLIGLNDDAGLLASVIGLGPMPGQFGGLLASGFTAELTATFEVRPVPLPAALPMLAAALAATALASRRSRRTLL